MTARLHLQPRATRLEFEGAASVTLSVGIHGLASEVFRHDPPTPAELERAIDIVEEALTQSRLAQADRGDLAIADASLRALPGLETPDAHLSRDAIEALFQRLASRSLGTPVAENELPAGRDVAAALLIVRECLHHLGFAGVTSTEGPSGD